MNFSKRDPLMLILPSFDEDRRYLSLESPCEDCKGTGERDKDGLYYDRSKICSYCEGRGVVLNVNGKAIIELMSCYTKSKDSDVLLAKKDF